MSHDAPEAIVPLAPLERRILGVLVEKQKTSKSPDAYPMTLNSLTTGCNQKSNRDPVTELNDDDIEEGLGRLQRVGLVSKLVGGRTDRYRHLLYEAWRVQKVELAVLAELLLRGPQTEGDLRGRASRMDDIPDLDALKTSLRALTERKMVVYVTAADRRGAMLTHGFHSPAELDAARARFAHGAPEPESRAAPVAEAGPKLADAFEQIRQLKDEVNHLREQLLALRTELGHRG